MSDFKTLCEKLEAEIIQSYTEGVTLEDAEKLAGQFLHAQMRVSEELKKADLDARMRKSGLKTVKAVVYQDAIAKADKKPTEGALEHIINADELVNGEQDAFDEAEVERDNLDRYFSIFTNAYHHFKAIAKGRFD